MLRPYFFSQLIIYWYKVQVPWVGIKPKAHNCQSQALTTQLGGHIPPDVELDTAVVARAPKEKGKQTIV